MRRILSLLLVFTFLSGSVFAESLDISGFSMEELESLYNQIAQRLTIINSGDIVYDQDGITIAWVGIKNRNRAGLICTNQTGQDYHFALIGFGVNGIMVDPSSNGASVEFPNGMSLYTGGYHSWIFDNAVLNELKITQLHTVYVKIGLYHEAGKRFIASPDLEIAVSFPVDQVLELDN